MLWNQEVRAGLICGSDAVSSVRMWSGRVPRSLMDPLGVLVFCPRPF